MPPTLKGNPLTSKLLLPGWSIQNDGFGLWTGRCVFKIARTSALTGSPFSSAVPKRGDVHPDPSCEHMIANKVSATVENGVVIATVEYVGIKTSTGGGSYTDPAVSGAVGTSTEPIENHPNFFDQVIGTASPIAGHGSGTASSPIYAADPSIKRDPSDTAVYYMGSNGAAFAAEGGGKFCGFLDPQYRRYYGRRSYMAPTTSFSGVVYTTIASKTVELRDAVGRSSSTNVFAGVKLLPNYMGTVWTSDDVDELPQLLLNGVNFEDFGNLYKISYSIRYNAEGYTQDIYPLSP